MAASEPDNIVSRRMALRILKGQTGCEVLGKQVSPLIENAQLKEGDYKLSLPRQMFSKHRDLGAVLSLLWRMTWRNPDGEIGAVFLWQHPMGAIFVAPMDGAGMNAIRTANCNYHPSELLVSAFELAPFFFENMETAIAAVLADAGIISIDCQPRSDVLSVVKIWKKDRLAHFNEVWTGDWKYEASDITAIPFD